MATKKLKNAGERLPGFSTARAHPNSGLKDVILAQPVCPNSQIRGRMVDGHYEPPILGPGDENCQLAGGQWWKLCESKGHDPYWSKRQVIRTKMTTAVDEEGDTIPVEKKIVLTDKVLNATSVSTSLRINSGQGVRWKKRYFGYKSISDFGFAEACHLSRCQEPATTFAQQYGAFCSMLHLQLAAAEDNEIMLSRADNPYLDQMDAPKVRRKRARQLRNAVDDVDINEDGG